MTSIKYFVVLLIGTIAFYGSNGLAGDVNDVVKLLEAKINSARIREYPPEIKIQGEQLINADPCQILNLLGKYENDPCWIVREQTYRQEVYFAKMRSEPWIKQEVVYRLVKAFVDPNLELSGQAYTWLLTFTEKDFDNETKLIIRKAMGKPGKGTVLICGVANIQDELPNLKKLLVDELEYQKRTGEPWWFQLSWYARIARARMGIKEDIKRCINLVESDKTRGIGVLTPLNEIGYIRQPEAIDFLKTYVFSDETIGQVKPTAPGEPVASYVMGILADCLENFPIKKREERGYKQEEIELCRKWMSEQKEWKIIR